MTSDVNIHQSTRKPPEDLIDFHLRWTDFRNDALRVQDSKNLNIEEKEVIMWLISLADRISESDLD